MWLQKKEAFSFMYLLRIKHYAWHSLNLFSVNLHNPGRWGSQSSDRLNTFPKKYSYNCSLSIRYSIWSPPVCHTVAKFLSWVEILNSPQSTGRRELSSGPRSWSLCLEPGFMLRSNVLWFQRWTRRSPCPRRAHSLGEETDKFPRNFTILRQ